ncbi:hypothetical protein [Streptomyces sp. NPDC002132]|uniref:hypothetical protein n=1 Tax=unclassified Streptomyces TaxID=2593676 RepID=UPI00332DD432
MTAVADRVRAVLALLGPLGAGSRVLLWRLIARFGWKMVGLGALVCVFAAVRYRTWIAWMLAAWCLAAWMHTPDKAAGDADDTAGEEPAETVADPLPAVLWTLIGEAPGVHLKAVAEHLHAAAPEQAVDRAAVRAHLAARQIPVRASVRDASGRVNEGVHRDDLRAWQEALSPAAPDPAPGPCSSPVATAVTCDVADAPTGVATPRSPLRRLLSRGAG